MIYLPWTIGSFCSIFGCMKNIYLIFVYSFVRYENTVRLKIFLPSSILPWYYYFQPCHIVKKVAETVGIYNLTINALPDDLPWEWYKLLEIINWYQENYTIISLCIYRGKEMRLKMYFLRASYKSPQMFLAGYFIGASDRWSRWNKKMVCSSPSSSFFLFKNFLV